MVDALNYTARMTGPHGPPLILSADWNDTLHLSMECDDPESVLTGESYVHALKLMAEMAEIYGKKSDAGEFLTRAAEMTRLINERCCDGEWYLRDFGSEVIGTRRNDVAKIFLNSQVWAVISGVAGPDRAIQCMDSARKYLFCDEGVKKVWPPFTQYDQTYGLISRYNAGRKENGIFAHANAWVVAESILGRPEYAYEYYRTILPLRRNDRAEVLKTEPYIFCQTICSDDAQDKGKGANSWLTGTASWMYMAATQYLLGIKPVLEGLKVTRCCRRIGMVSKCAGHFKGVLMTLGRNMERNKGRLRFQWFNIVKIVLKYNNFSL
jgi:cellobiose phosphorylase